MRYSQKIIILGLLILLIISIVFMNINFHKNFKIAENLSESTKEEIEQTPISICYYKSNKTDRNLYNVSWLSFEINGENIKGEFQNIPAEKDSKIGKFEGKVGPLVPEKMAREANVIWETYAEGMNNKEELKFDFGDGNASVYFAEMENRGDGVYVYKNKSTQQSYRIQMNQIDCSDLEEKLYMEKYVKDHINEVANQQAVLGGEWYVLSVFINPSTKRGEVVYEDGHIQSATDFSYTYDKISKIVSFNK